MQKNNLLLLLGLVIVAAIVLWFITRADAESTADLDSALPELDINAVQSWSVNSASASLQFVKDGEQWRLQQKGGYPADTAKVFAALQAFVAADVVEVKTNEPTYFAQLDLQSIDEPDSAAQQLSINGEPMLLIGKYRTFGGEDTTFVRQPDGQQVWQVSGNLRQNLQASQWIKTDIFNVARSQIKSITIQHNDGETVRVQRPSLDKDFMVANIPAGRELLYGNVGASLTTALENLQFEDVARADQADEDFTASSTAMYELFDGTTISTKNNGQMLQVQVSGNTDTAKQLASAVDGWQFTIAALKADFFQRRMDDLLKSLPELGAAEPAVNVTPLSLPVPEILPRAVSPNSQPSPEPPSEQRAAGENTE